MKPMNIEEIYQGKPVHVVTLGQAHKCNLLGIDYDARILFAEYPEEGKEEGKDPKMATLSIPLEHVLFITDGAIKMQTAPMLGAAGGFPPNGFNPFKH